MPVVLYECETWSVTLREKHKLRVFESRALRKKFGSKRDNVTREWGRRHNEELYDLCSSSNIIRAMKSRSMKWAGYVARIRDRRAAYWALVGDLRERAHLEDLGVDGRVILKWFFKK